jgi:hypothetical protein
MNFKFRHPLDLFNQQQNPRNLVILKYPAFDLCTKIFQDGENILLNVKLIIC